MKPETEKYILDKLAQTAVAASEEGSPKSKLYWAMYGEFKRSIKNERQLRWLVKWFPQLTMGIGFVIGVIVARLF